MKNLQNRLQKIVLWVGIVSTLLTAGGVIFSRIKRAYEDIRENRGFSEVLCGLLIADMEPVDSCSYFVEIDGLKVQAELRKSLSGNVYVFILNNRLMVYGAWYDNSKQLYCYFDFGGNYRLIQKE